MTPKSKLKIGPAFLNRPGTYEAASASAKPPVASSLQLFTLRQAATRLGVAVVTARRRIREGALGHVRIKNRIYVKPSDLQVFIARHQIEAAVDQV